MMANVPSDRIQISNASPINSDGDYVLYWMTAFRRPNFNFALERAVELANQLEKPLLVFEPLRIGYRWASRRFHQFVIQGMQVNRTAFESAGANYLAYVERSSGEGSGLVERLAERAAAVISDDCPAFFYPALHRLLQRKLAVRWESVDANGILPMRVAPKVFSRAHFFRSFLQKNLLDHLGTFPESQPLDQLRNQNKADLSFLPQQWCQPAETIDQSFIEQLEIDHSVGSLGEVGGYETAEEKLNLFVAAKLGNYGDRRNHPQEQTTSGLSGYLHFGHISPHQVLLRILESENWSPDRITKVRAGKAEGWWGMSPSAEGFLDQLTTWRELGFNMAWQDRNYTQYDSLPEWARKTLHEHRRDPRDPCYSLEEFEGAATHDPLWNAAQNQLREEGVIHNYLRMLWGKKILHWSASPEEALQIMIHLNNKYALDGRDPNSYSGIFWILGRYDRAWGPERPIFGKIRYMASENTARKFPVKQYIEHFTSASSQEKTGSLFPE